MPSACDGLYEQRLIQQVVQARTGQRLSMVRITDGSAVRKYLMDQCDPEQAATEPGSGYLTSQIVVALDPRHRLARTARK